MTTQLKLYNACLLAVGDRKIAALTNNVEARRVIDDAYDDVLADCLEAGMWNFATRTVQMDYDQTITPNFGYRYVFGKPSDWVRTVGVSLDENFSIPLLRYYDDQVYWSCDATPIYVRFVSNSTDFGLNLGNWPRSFTRFVELELAYRVVERLTQSESKKDRIFVDLKKAKTLALNRDAMNEPNTKFAPTGSWNAARGGGRSASNRGGWPPQIS